MLNDGALTTTKAPARRRGLLIAANLAAVTVLFVAAQPGPDARVVLAEHAAAVPLRLIADPPTGLAGGEATPFVFAGRLYRLEGYRNDEARAIVRDVASGVVVSTAMRGRAFASAFVDGDRVLVAATRDRRTVELTESRDLRTWSEPRVIARARAGERLFNVALARDDHLVALVESDDATIPFVFRFLAEDRGTWNPIGGTFGEDRYVGGPALYRSAGWWYTTYLHDLGFFDPGPWETRIARSRDLITWQHAAAAFVVPDPTRTVCTAGRCTPETNASDVELTDWQGTTVITWGVGNQLDIGALRTGRFPAPLDDVLAAWFR